MSAILAACSSGASEEENGKIKAVSTIGMIGDVVSNIGGEHVESVSLMKPGIDPHLYKATQGDMTKLEGAEIIFYNGLHLEGQMIDIFEQMEKKKPTVAVTQNVSADGLLAGEDSSEHDPHLWFNVEYWIESAKVIRDELIELDEDHKEDYEKNAEEYIAKMEELDEYVKEQIATIPKENRVLVTAHDAFGYFGDAYDIQVMGLQGISTESEVGSKDVSELRDFLVENKIKAVFVESSVPKDTIEAVIEGAKKMGHEVTIGGELFSDAMGDEGTEEGTYLGMVRHNVDTIVKALK
ncbi:zinc ABC transporter substrate-binding protein [Bacillus sp. AGMB 02131]|uniref:Zinc ABC transporter substrate-binding protein n=1 Tax=Peribacillus faecalis TaxID=2772559 RepID=A0A927D1T5_9BACI|nr:zinc ABC transporter substrate-binding protein [Peribacillus faecalis]MBD3109950.1 zinc ABC transporter substrate-binding protein [Peribacillus faecalis]